MFFFQSALAEAVQTGQTEAAPSFITAVSDFFARAFSKFSSFGLTTWLALLALLALGLVLLAAAKSKKKWNARVIAYAALSIALSFVLSYIRLFRMPQGGSITPGSMLPLMLFSAAFGVGPGVVAGLAYGLMQYLQGGDFLNVWQFLLDYQMAFAALGLAGTYKHLDKRWQTYLALGLTLAGLTLLSVAYPENLGLYLAALIVVAAMTALYFFKPKSCSLLPAMGLAVLARAASAVCAGLVWVAAYPVEGQIPIVYSLAYNGAYLLPELVICMALAALMGERVFKLMRTTT